MINLCLDANVYLSFYYYSDVDLTSLEKLIKLIESEKLKLILTKQVIDEYNRNRETKIKEALNLIKDSKLEFNAPKILNNYSEFSDIRKNLKKINTEKDKLVKKLKKDISNRQLHADKLIDKLFASAFKINYNDSDIEKARLRSELGNPPGKKGSIGDAINWELLLDNIPDKTDLYFVSEDGDFASKIDANNFSDFLNDEWNDKKKSRLIFYKSFTELIKNIFTTIKLKNEQETEDLINKLENSINFDFSRSTLAQLLQLNTLSDSQLNRIMEASYTNNQIYMANDYSPNQISEVIKKIIDGKEYRLRQDIYLKFCIKFGITPIINDDDLPF